MNPELTAAAEKAAYERGRRESKTEIAELKKQLRAANEVIDGLRDELRAVDKWLEANFDK